jgi:hypothetical protein
VRCVVNVNVSTRRRRASGSQTDIGAGRMLPIVILMLVNRCRNLYVRIWMSVVRVIIEILRDGMAFVTLLRISSSNGVLVAFSDTWYDNKRLNVL